jgi:antitoxin component YwqK of YwqJK toxin-antitoxin module
MQKRGNMKEIKIVKDKNGLLLRQETWENGKLNGEYITYYENGSIFTKCNFKNNKKHGEFNSFNKMDH